MARKPTLKSLYSSHTGKVSDKWDLYLSEYERLFKPLRAKPLNLLEIGIQNGGSLEIWGKYFENAQHIIGCDINERCKKLKFEDERIQVIVDDAVQRVTADNIQNLQSNFDLIIEDGSHTSGDIINSFLLYFPMLTDNGIYIAEDIHCSYWGEFDGGLFHPTSSLAFMKFLGDIVNYEHWSIEQARSSLVEHFPIIEGIENLEETLSEIHSIEFINSVCIIRKMNSKKNQLGKRNVVGEEEVVEKGLKKLPPFVEPPSQQSSNFWSSMSASNSNISALKIQISEIFESNRQLQTNLEEIVSSERKLEDALSAKEDEIKSLIETFSDQRQHSGNLEKAIEEHLKHINKLKEDLAAKERHIENVSKANATHKSHIDSLEKQSSTRSKHIVNLEAKITSLSERTEQQQTWISEKGLHIKNLTRNVEITRKSHKKARDEFEVAISQTTNHANNLEKMILALKAEKELTLRELALAKEHIENQDDTLGALRSENHQCLKGLKAKDSHIANQTETLDAIRNENHQYLKDLKAKDSHIANQAETLEAIRNENHQYSKDLKAKDSHIANQAETLEAMKNEIRQHLKDLTAKDIHMVKLADSIELLKAKTDDQLLQISFLESDSNTMQASIIDHQYTNRTLSTNLTNSEEVYNALVSETNLLRTELSEIKNSSIWRWTSPVRRIGGSLKTKEKSK